MNNLFGISRGITYLIIGASLIFIVGMISNMAAKKISGKPYYQIISPDGDYHLTDEYKTEGNCIIFVDEIGTENRVCGSYRIKKF